MIVLFSESAAWYGLQQRRRRRAFFSTELTFSLVLALFLLMLMSVIIVRQCAAEAKLAAIRTATRSAESALFSIQAGADAPPDARLQPLSNPAPAGYQWVRLTSGDNKTSLVGLVRLRNTGAQR